LTLANSDTIEADALKELERGRGRGTPRTLTLLAHLDERAGKVLCQKRVREWVQWGLELGDEEAFRITRETSFYEGLGDLRERDKKTV
jgi:hypothetical protein